MYVLRSVMNAQMLGVSLFLCRNSMLRLEGGAWSKRSNHPAIEQPPTSPSFAIYKKNSKQGVYDSFIQKANSGVVPERTRVGGRARGVSVGTPGSDDRPTTKKQTDQSLGPQTCVIRKEGIHTAVTHAERNTERTVRGTSVGAISRTFVLFPAPATRASYHIYGRPNGTVEIVPFPPVCFKNTTTTVTCFSRRT